MLTGINVGHEKCRALAKHWETLPKSDGGLLPRRSDLRPESVPGLLPNMVMFEVLSRDFVRFRLVGTAVVARYGEDPTGANYLDYVAPEMRNQSAMAFWAMQAQPCGMWGISRQDYAGGKSIRSEAIGFPVLGSPGEPVILLFQQVAVEKPTHLNTREDELLRHVIEQRQFIDIGAGVPEAPG